jgi:shikimate kinase
VNIVLIGYRGSGKSTVGRLLAERLAFAFVDTDALIQQRTGMTIREIFADQAEEGFRNLESQVVAEVARQDRCVISTGGGAVLRDENARALRQSGRLVYLTAPAEVLWKRIFADVHRHATRLKMDPDTGLQQVRHALQAREAVYARIADVVVDTNGRSVQGIVDRIVTRVNLRHGPG